MEKWRSIAAGMSCLSMLFATGAVTVSASDEITEIPEQSIVYWSMWEEDEPQADVIREAAEAYEEATGISVEIQWKGRGIQSLIGPALDAGEQIDLFDDDYHAQQLYRLLVATDLAVLRISFRRRLFFPHHLRKRSRSRPCRPLHYHALDHRHDIDPCFL